MVERKTGGKRSTRDAKKAAGLTPQPDSTIELEIPRPDTARVWVRVRQLAPESPLVVHRFHEKARQQLMDKKQQKAKAPRGKYDPHAAFLAAKHLDSEGRDCVPACAFKAAIISAARLVEYITMSALKQMVFVEGDLLPLNFDRCENYESYVRLAGPGKNPDIRNRPMYHGWSVDLVIEYNQKLLSPSQLLHLLQLAGHSVGLCEGRPASSSVLGWGRFEIDPDQTPVGDAVRTAA